MSALANQNRSTIRAYIGLGSNLNEPRAHVDQALLEIRALPATRLMAQSKFYQTAPVGPANQPDFINAVAAVDTSLAPETLLMALQDLEQRHGRVRDPAMRFGPRSLDLDILLYGDQKIDTGLLKVPHPRMHQRRFVLVPLMDIAANIVIPGHGPIKKLLATAPALEMQALR